MLTLGSEPIKNEGAGPKLPGWIKYYLRFVLPVLILIIFITGLI